MALRPQTLVLEAAADRASWRSWGSPSPTCWATGSGSTARSPSGRAATSWRRSAPADRGGARRAPRRRPGGRSRTWSGRSRRPASRSSAPSTVRREGGRRRGAAERGGEPPGRAAPRGRASPWASRRSGSSPRPTSRASTGERFVESFWEQMELDPRVPAGDLSRHGRRGGMKLDVLAIGAHPDDVELGCGGTLALLARQGRKVGILHLTRGERGHARHGRGAARPRRSAAAEALGAVELDFLDCGDGALRTGEAEEDALIEVLRALAARAGPRARRRATATRTTRAPTSWWTRPASTPGCANRAPRRAAAPAGRGLLLHAARPLRAELHRRRHRRSGRRKMESLRGLPQPALSSRAETEERTISRRPRWRRRSSGWPSRGGPATSA